MAQALAANILRYKIWPAVPLACRVTRENVGVPQRGFGSSLTCEPLTLGSITGDFRTKQFDGDIRPCLDVAGMINLSDPAETSGPDDLVWADPVSCRESHRLAIVRPLLTTLG